MLGRLCRAVGFVEDTTLPFRGGLPACWNAVREAILHPIERRVGRLQAGSLLRPSVGRNGTKNGQR